MSLSFAFTIEVYGFMHSLSLRTFLVRAPLDAIVRNGGQGLGGEKTGPEPFPRYGRPLTTQRRMKDKIRVTGDDLPVSTRAIYFAR